MDLRDQSESLLPARAGAALGPNMRNYWH